MAAEKSRNHSSGGACIVNGMPLRLNRAQWEHSSWMSPRVIYVNGRQKRASPRKSMSALATPIECLLRGGSDPRWFTSHWMARLRRRSSRRRHAAWFSSRHVILCPTWTPRAVFRLRNKKVHEPYSWHIHPVAVHYAFHGTGPVVLPKVTELGPCSKPRAKENSRTINKAVTKKRNEANQL